ncbi:TIGR03086 family metal-binding protein [Amycolatopsis sp. NPDC004378]
MPDVRHHLATAEQQFVGTASQLTAKDLSRPTPCTEWDIRALLTHTVGTIVLFAAALDGAPGPDRSALAGTGDLLGSDIGASVEAALERSTRAWAAVSDMSAERETPLGPMSAERLAGIATFSAVVHGWDLAVSLGAHREIDPGLLAIARPVAAVMVPAMQAAGAFAPPLVTRDSAETAAFIASVGRDPAWPASPDVAR